MKMNFECELSWDDLTGPGDQRRHCGECNQSVYNLSSMTKDEALRLIAMHGDELPCIHFVREDGVIVHKGWPYGEPPGFRDPEATPEPVQLGRQKRGAGKLLAAAMCAHIGIVAFSEQPGVWYNPFAAAASLFTTTKVTHTIGEPEPVEPSLWAPEDEPQCDSDSACREAAADAVQEAQRIGASTDPGATYLSYEQLKRAEALLDQVHDSRESEIANVRTRLVELEDQLNEQFKEGRLRLFRLEKSKDYEEMAVAIQALQAEFPSRRSHWNRYATERERRLKDEGHWPSGQD